MELIRGVIAGRGRNVGVGNRRLLFLVFLDANSQMGPGIGLIFVAAAIRLLDRKKRLMLAPRPYPRKPFAKALVFVKMAQGHSSGAFYYAQTPARRFFVF